MSMLAERKRKTKWVINPTKKPLWTTDSSGIKFGKDLMEKMGWTTGKGLGVNEQGIQEPLKVSYKNDTKGMGYRGNDDDWIEQQEEFNELLNQLRNDNICSNIKISNKEKITKSLEEKSKLSKARVHYQKFTRGKDLSRYSDHDLACILGTNKMKKEKSKSEEIIQTEPKVIGNCETSFGVTTINSGSIQDYFKKKFNNSSYKFKDGTEISNESNQKRESCFLKSECNLVSDSNEEKFNKRKHKSNFECLNINENKTFESYELENLKSIVKNKKKKRELQEIDLEVRIKKRKKNCDDSNVFANGNSEQSEIHVINASKCEESKSLINKIDNSNSVKKRRKEKNQVELDVFESEKDNGSVAENKKEINYKNSCISEVSCAEKSRTNVEFALEEQTIERKKSEKPKKEKLKVINELKNEDCYVSATPLRSQNSYSVTEFCSEIESFTKKKKKENKEKYLKNEDIRSKDSDCPENEFFNNHGEKIIEITETDEVLDINITKKKKKKKSKKEKSEKGKESMDCYTESLEKSNLEEDLRKKSISTSEQENTQDIQSVRKKKKKKKKSKEEKLNEIEKADLEFGCDQLTKSILKETFKETNISQISFNAIEEDNIVESESFHKKRKKKYKKEEERETENISCCNNHGVEMQMQENVLELDFKEKKKRKREKLDEKVKSKMQFSCNDTEKPILEEMSEKRNNNVNIDFTKIELSKKEEEVNNGKEKSVENKVKLPEKIELNRKTFDEKIKLSDNKKNNFHPMMNNKMDEGTGVHKHKIELLNEKRADKFYPGQHTSKRVLRLISLSNIAGFKGSNLNDVVGYGFMPKYETIKSK